MLGEFIECSKPTTTTTLQSKSRRPVMPPSRGWVGPPTTPDNTAPLAQRRQWSACFWSVIDVGPTSEVALSPTVAIAFESAFFLAVVDVGPTSAIAI